MYWPYVLIVPFDAIIIINFVVNDYSPTYYACLLLQDLFVFEITSVTELALGANTKLPVNRLKWTTDCKYNIVKYNIVEYRHFGHSLDAGI